MRNTHEYLNILDRVPAAIGDVGIEVEVEAKAPLELLIPKDWDMKADGSLRNYGYEFITRGSVPIARSNKAVTELCKLLVKTVIPNSSRTSVHAHINVQFLTPLQVWTFATAYFLFENLLTEYAGPDRVGNMYCLRLKDAEHALALILNDMKKSIPFVSLRTDKLKYMGGNVNAIPRFGSFEIRTLRGEYSDRLINTWTNELVGLRDRSIKFGSPAILMDAFWNNGPCMIKDFFSEEFIRELTQACPRWMNLIEENGPLVAAMAYCQNDWGKWQDKNESYIDQFMRGPGSKPVKKPAIPIDIFMNNIAEVRRDPGRPWAPAERFQEIPDHLVAANDF